MVKGSTSAWVAAVCRRDRVWTSTKKECDGQWPVRRKQGVPVYDDSVEMLVALEPRPNQRYQGPIRFVGKTSRNTVPADLL